MSIVNIIKDPHRWFITPRVTLLMKLAGTEAMLESLEEEESNSRWGEKGLHDRLNFFAIDLGADEPR